jgi:hypothetical protein
MHSPFSIRHDPPIGASYRSALANGWHSENYDLLQHWLGLPKATAGPAWQRGKNQWHQNIYILANRE